MSGDEYYGLTILEVAWLSYTAPYSYAHIVNLGDGSMMFGSGVSIPRASPCLFAAPRLNSHRHVSVWLLVHSARHEVRLRIPRTLCSGADNCGMWTATTTDMPNIPRGISHEVSPCYSSTLSQRISSGRYTWS
jgi:hypothetical protein